MNATTAEAATAEAKQEKQRAEAQALNAEIQAESLAVENLMASNLNFKALLTALGLGNRIRASDGIDPPFKTLRLKKILKQLILTPLSLPAQFAPAFGCKQRPLYGKCIISMGFWSAIP